MDVPLDAIVQAAAHGQEQAWRELVAAYSGRVYAVIFRQCGNPELAEEITQATFASLAAHLRTYREQGHFEAWLFRIAINRFRDEMRQRQRQATTVDFNATPPENLGYDAPDCPSPDAAMDMEEQHARLRQAMDTLPEADREVLYLRYTAELSFQQIADTLHQPLGTVLARAHRALKKLRHQLNEETV